MSDVVDHVSELSYETWLDNHKDDHDARWLRELYPWALFARIDYSSPLVGKQQVFEHDDAAFEVTIESKDLGRIGRTEFLVYLKAIQKSKTKKWVHGLWDDRFVLIAAPDGKFITLFTKKKDPHKKSLSDFMRGTMTRIEMRRSLPLAGLLFRSIVRYIAERNFGSLQDRKYFSPLAEPRRNGYQNHSTIDSEFSTSFSPFLSEGRRLWILHSFTEEKAHRLAIRAEAACDSLIVVYCHPTLSKHHRSIDPQTKVVSLIEFAELNHPQTARDFLGQIRFLVNHLRMPDNGMSPVGDKVLSVEEIAQGKQSTITTSELREAVAALGLTPITLGEIAYFFAAANLLNAALNKKAKYYTGSIKIPKEAYAFKSRVAAVIYRLIDNPVLGVDLYFAEDGLTYISIKNTQFSFHSIPRNAVVLDFMGSSRNTPQNWSEIRLQPVASAVLRWGRNMYTPPVQDILKPRP